MSTDSSGTATLSDQVATEILGLMGKRRINKAEMARRLGEKPDWIGRRLNGRQDFSLEDLQRVAVVLGVDAADLLPKSVTGRYPTRVSDPRIIATIGQDRSTGSIVRTKRPAHRPHRPGRAVSATRPLVPLDRRMTASSGR